MTASSKLPKQIKTERWLMAVIGASFVLMGYALGQVLVLPLPADRVVSMAVLSVMLLAALVVAKLWRFFQSVYGWSFHLYCQLPTLSKL